MLFWKGSEVLVMLFEHIKFLRALSQIVKDLLSCRSRERSTGPKPASEAEFRSRSLEQGFEEYVRRRVSQQKSTAELKAGVQSRSPQQGLKQKPRAGFKTEVHTRTQTSHLYCNVHSLMHCETCKGPPFTGDAARTEIRIRRLWNTLSQ